MFIISSRFVQSKAISLPTVYMYVAILVLLT